MSKIEKRQQETKQLLIKQLKKTPIIQVACEKIGLARSTYYRWCKDDSNFDFEANQALNRGKQLINDMAESQLISAIRDQNMTAIIFWLKHHHGDYATKVELSGEVKTAGSVLTPEQEEAIQKAIALVALSPNNISLKQKKDG